MIDPCALHRPYLAALADGEVDLVPEATRDHVSGCADCADEVAQHGLLGEKLRAGFEQRMRRARQARRSAARVRRAAAVIGVAATLALAGLGGVLGWRATHGGTDVIDAAVTAAQLGPALRSSDPDAIGAWCARTSDRQRPQVALPPLVPLGARMDTVGGTNVVTVFYTVADWGHVAVGWLDAAASRPGDSRIQARAAGGGTALVVQTPRGTAVVTGDAPKATLWESAATLESLTG